MAAAATAAKDTEDVVGAIIFDRTGKMLVVRGIGGPDSKWSFPKGRRKEGETFLEACIREAREEAGIHLAGIRYRAQIRLAYGSYFLYLLDRPSEAIRLSEPATPEEISEVAWRHPASLADPAECYKSNADLRFYLKKESKPSRNFQKLHQRKP